MMRDPLYPDDARLDRLVADKSVAPTVRCLRWLKLASGLIALGLVAAIWIVWRWAGMN
jgi:hypothetical protein